MSTAAHTMVVPPQGRRGARGVLATLFVVAALMATFAIGRWSAAESTVQQRPQPVVIVPQHVAPEHDGTVKGG
jgi:hypothetical protein